MAYTRRTFGGSVFSSTSGLNSAHLCSLFSNQWHSKDPVLTMLPTVIAGPPDFSLTTSPVWKDSSAISHLLAAEAIREMRGKSTKRRRAWAARCAPAHAALGAALDCGHDLDVVPIMQSKGVHACPAQARLFPVVRDRFLPRPHVCRARVRLSSSRGGDGVRSCTAALVSSYSGRIRMSQCKT